MEYFKKKNDNVTLKVCAIRKDSILFKKNIWQETLKLPIVDVTE